MVCRARVAAYRQALPNRRQESHRITCHYAGGRLTEAYRQLAARWLAQLAGSGVSRVPGNYLTSLELLTIVRILHGKRDLAALLEKEKLETPTD